MLGIFYSHKSSNEAKTKIESANFKKQTELENAKQIKVKIEEVSIEFKNKAGENGKLFGSITEKMALQGNCMLSIIFPTNPDKDAYTDEEKELFGKIHKEKIKISNAILVVNIDNYIGSSTKSEIEFAKALNKEIIYYTDIINNN